MYQLKTGKFSGEPQLSNARFPASIHCKQAAPFHSSLTTRGNMWASKSFNIAEIVIKTSHWVSFSISPIDTKRLITEYNERLISRQAGVNLPEDQPNGAASRHWWWQFLHPIDLLINIEHYHLVDWRFIIIFSVHLMILLHLTIKNAIHSIYTGNDKELNDYFDSIYYPRVSNVLLEPHLFNNLTFVICAYCLCVRLLCALRLIRRSSINANKYTEISVTQLNFSMLTLANFTMAEWQRFWNHCSEHEKSIKTNKLARKAHLRFNETLQKRLNDHKQTQFDLIFHSNMFDYDECFEGIRDLIKLERRKVCYRSWYIAPPYMRVNLRLAKLGVILMIWGHSLLFFGSLLAIWGMFYLELRTSTNYQTASTVFEKVYAWAVHMSCPLHLLRVVEMNLLIILQTPHHFDAFMLVYDFAILITKANKVIGAVEEDLKLNSFHREQLSSDNDDYLQSNYLLNVGFNESSNRPTTRKLGNTQLNTIRFKVNERLRRHIHLISLLYSEFLDLRRVHTIFINIIIVGNGIALSYTLSLFMAIKELSGLAVLTATLVSCLVPVIFSLVSCAAVEQVFKRLYAVLCRLVVNQRGLLDSRTIRSSIIASKLFERKEDRSFLFLGLYSITPEALTPVSMRLINPINRSSRL